MARIVNRLERLALPKQQTAMSHVWVIEIGVEEYTEWSEQRRKLFLETMAVLAGVVAVDVQAGE